MLIERAIVSGRLTPAALAIITAAFTLGIQPTGLIAVAALLAGGRPILRILVRRHRLVGTWPLVLPLLAAGTVILTVVFADQTLATVLEATRIRTAIGPSQAWYTENLRYYYLILPTVDGSLSRRFGFLITALCLFTVDVHHVAAQANSRCGPRPGVAADGCHLRHHVLPDVHPDQVGAPLRAVRRGGRGDGGAGDGAGVAEVLRSARNRMAFLAAVLFVLALCFATTNGWWYVSSFGVPFNNDDADDRRNHRQHNLFRPVRDRRAVGVLAALRARDHGEGRLARALTAAPIPVAAGFMVLVFVGVDGHRRGAPVPDLLQRVGQPAGVRRRLRAGRRRAGRARRQRRLPDAAAGRLRPAGPAGRRPARSASPPTAYRNTSSPRRSG